MIRLGLGLRGRLGRAPWTLATALLPQAVVYELWHRRQLSSRRTELATASQQQVFHPQPGVVLEVYWSDVDGVGRGPSASLFVLGEEVLRLDCFGDDRGHMHFNPAQAQLTAVLHTPRIHFPPAPVSDQIQRAAFELECNAEAAKASNLLARVRGFELDRRALARGARDMAAAMSEMVAGHGAGRG